MIPGLADYDSPSLIADHETRKSLSDFITATLEALSTPGSEIASYFADPDVAIAGSGLDEFFMGPRAAQEGTAWVATLGLRWVPHTLVSWQRGDIAWAQVRMDAHTVENDVEVAVPYVMTGIFARSNGDWTWLYWGGGEPQDPPRV